MELSEEWKAYFPIGKSLEPPLLSSSSSSSSTNHGPLFFIPKPKTLPKTLFSSPSLLPPLLPPPPRLSFSRFLSTSSVPYSTSFSIASRFGPTSSHHHDVSSLLSHNRLRLLHCLDHNISIVFFTTGSNHDRIGFFSVHVQDGDFTFLGDRNGDVFVSNNHFNHKISSILVNPVDDFDGISGDSVVGYLMASTLYAVHWLFCYGPSSANEGSIAMGISKFCKPFLAWDLPSDFPLSNQECHCGSCLVRQEFSKGALPEWIDWQQKKDIVLGFGILSRDLLELVHESDEFGGFTLIRLMSSGKIEAQRYCASWDLVHSFDPAHRETLFNFEDSLLCSLGDDEYEFPKKFKYLNLEYLRGYLNDNLAKVLDSKMKKFHKGPLQKESFSLDLHEILCEKLKICGFGRFRSSPALAIVFNDISLPTSICEVASRQMWATLPLEFLLLAFSSYPELLDVPFDDKTMPLEFSVVPDLPQLPPFLLRKPSSRGTRWSDKVQPDDSLVGPALPLPILLTLHEFHNGCPDSEKECEFSSDVELALRCNEVMQVATEMAVSDPSLLNNDQTVSLADDRDEMWADSQRPKPFLLYHPVGGESSSIDQLQGNHTFKDEKFATMITKVRKETDPNNTTDNVGLELFDDLCPIELKFDFPAMNFGTQELEAFKTLKRQFAKWQERFKPYQELCMQNNKDIQKMA
ncbi:hypothetical protein V6N13_087580 [Hibiscus sabdariffa]